MNVAGSSKDHAMSSMGGKHGAVAEACSPGKTFSWWTITGSDDVVRSCSRAIGKAEVIVNLPLLLTLILIWRCTIQEDCSSTVI
ncbi:hypothetical protein HPP92_026571 [Vanilla planifolia]|uniref:Uncharacterized protein n=1 Tax=Vanilla planifolia TaxID=51239 RepID=A0A835PBS5_VANPL|nr:hypothetical protein HPP92_026571 [Vanilla planifolia]